MSAEEAANLPMSMRYSVSGRDAIPSRTKLTRWDSTSASYSANSNNKILIPIASDGFIDTTKGYLYFKLQNNNDGNATLDGDARSVIEKIEISVAGSSGRVETLDRYNIMSLYKKVWNTSLEDWCADQALTGGNQPFSNVVTTARIDPANTQQAGGAGGATANSFTNIVAGTTLSSGDNVKLGAWSPDGDVFATTTSRHYCIPLDVGFLNSYYGKALPMGLPQFTLEITLAGVTQPFVTSSTTATLNYTLSNVRYYAPTYEILDETSMSVYRNKLTTNATMWVGQSVQTIINSVNNTSGRQTFQINSSFKSLNSLVSLMRPAANILNKDDNCLTAFNLTGVTDYLYRINSQQYPQDEVEFKKNGANGNQGRAWLEASKSLAPHGQKYAKTCAITATTFGNDDGLGSASGRGSLCVDLKRFTDERLVNLGLNTSGNSAPSTLEINFNTDIAAAQDLTTFAMYDCVWVLQPNGLVERIF